MRYGAYSSSEVKSASDDDVNVVLVEVAVLVVLVEVLVEVR